MGDKTQPRSSEANPDTVPQDAGVGSFYLNLEASMCALEISASSQEVSTSSRQIPAISQEAAAQAR